MKPRPGWRSPDKRDSCPPDPPAGLARSGSPRPLSEARRKGPRSKEAHPPRKCAERRSAGPAAAPAIGVGDFGQWAAGQRTEFVDRPTDWHQREGRNILGNAEQRLDFALTADVVGRDHGPEAQAAASEDDVLHRRVNAGAANAVGVSNLFCPMSPNVRR